jgi:L-alanine-DL-glutamate epimerase-like enolase superfamily enzyme
MDRIQKVEIHEYDYVVENLALGKGHHRHFSRGARTTMRNFIVVIRTSGGAVGEYACMFGGKRAQLGQVLMTAPLLIGCNPDHREALYNDMKRHTRQLGFLGVGMLDICLWDLAGKRLGASVSRLLGGFRSRVPAYASTQFGSEEGEFSTKEHYAAFAEQCLGLGFRAYKMHGWAGGEVRREAENVLHVARAVGSRMALMLDPACEIRTFADALYLGRACDEAGYFWYEDPLMDGGVSQHVYRKLRQMLKTPLLITEHVRGVEPKADWIVAEATDFVRADPELDLGITGTMKIAHLAEAFGLDVELHAVGPAHRHCIAAIRNTNYYELALVAPGARNPVPPVFACGYSDEVEDVGADGCYPVPDGPGLGVTIDWGFIDRHRTQCHVFE